jgi:hypothetical protein
MWRLAAPFTAFVLLGASFLRAGNAFMLVICGALLVLLAVPRPWAPWIVRVALVLAAARWLWITWTLAAMRSAAGAPYARMAAILVTVALLTLLATLVFRSRRLRRYYRLEASTAS